MTDRKQNLEMYVHQVHAEKLRNKIIRVQIGHPERYGDFRSEEIFQRKCIRKREYRKTLIVKVLRKIDFCMQLFPLYFFRKIPSDVNSIKFWIFNIHLDL